MNAPTDTTIATYAEGACDQHGGYISHNGCCPTRTRIRQARRTLRRAPVRSHEYVEAMALLDEIGQRGTDLIAGDTLELGGAA